ncbi:MAG TPA: chemotaxis protein CheX [Verrucomicrobiae bacterium]|jgi:CheY-specific phosphatase CheX|nr:chemotaxis protein CheX [Verrucomicrobiae bacterium]
MATAAQSEEIARRYGLAAIPESVLRLTRLVAGQDADLGLVAKVIAQDKDLSNRLLRLAHPRATSPLEASPDAIETALMRTGMGSIFVLAMGDLLMRAVLKTFHTMLGIELQWVVSPGAPTCSSPQVVSEVAFSGRASGRVFLHQSEEASRTITTRMLGLGANDEISQGEIEDAIAEAANMGAGNFLSNLCDAGLPCKLSAPKTARLESFQLRPGPAGSREQMVFRSPELVTFVDICVDEWNF